VIGLNPERLPKVLKAHLEQFRHKLFIDEDRHPYMTKTDILI
jgi:hypothetical protein